jgi:hypothetical protein
MTEKTLADAIVLLTEGCTKLLHRIEALEKEIAWQRTHSHLYWAPAGAEAVSKSTANPSRGLGDLTLPRPAEPDLPEGGTCNNR